MTKKNSHTLKKELVSIKEHLEETIATLSVMMDKKINHSLALIDESCLSEYRNLKMIRERLKEIL